MLPIERLDSLYIILIVSMKYSPIVTNAVITRRLQRFMQYTLQFVTFYLMVVFPLPPFIMLVIFIFMFIIFLEAGIVDSTGGAVAPDRVGVSVGGTATGVGRGVGAGVGRGVGAGVGRGVGAGVGRGVGAGVGRGVGLAVGNAVGRGTVLPSHSMGGLPL